MAFWSTWSYPLPAFTLCSVPLSALCEWQPGREEKKGEPELQVRVKTFSGPVPPSFFSILKKDLLIWKATHTHTHTEHAQEGFSLVHCLDGYNNQVLAGLKPEARHSIPLFYNVTRMPIWAIFCEFPKYFVGNWIGRELLGFELALSHISLELQVGLEIQYRYMSITL